LLQKYHDHTFPRQTRTKQETTYVRTRNQKCTRRIGNATGPVPVNHTSATLPRQLRPLLVQRLQLPLQPLEGVSLLFQFSIAAGSMAAAASMANLTIAAALGWCR
jgi:hypothetical protein